MIFNKIYPACKYYEKFVRLILRAGQARLRNEMNLARATCKSSRSTGSTNQSESRESYSIVCRYSAGLAPLGPLKPNMVTIYWASFSCVVQEHNRCFGLFNI